MPFTRSLLAHERSPVAAVGHRPGPGLDRAPRPLRRRHRAKTRSRSLAALEPPDPVELALLALGRQPLLRCSDAGSAAWRLWPRGADPAPRGLGSRPDHRLRPDPERLPRAAEAGSAQPGNDPLLLGHLLPDHRLRRLRPHWPDG